MKQWYAKELSRLSGVSVRTLHHYDNIQLLKPSLRLENGYRLYSEKDLLKLQQIIALKFFGFELAQIKILLTNHDDAIENFAMQAQFLKEKAERLMEASTILQQLIENQTFDKSIPWEKTIQLIEVYHMTQQLEHAWVKEIFNVDELKQYAAFEAELKSRSTPVGKDTFEKQWVSLVEEIKNNLQIEPSSKAGIHLGEKFMNWVNGVYGKKYAHLRTKKFERGFGEGKGLEDVGMTPEIVAWIELATNAYWAQRLYDILSKVGVSSSTEILNRWDQLMDDMYGEEVARKIQVAHQLLLDDKVSPLAKKWLKETFNL